MKKKTLTVFEKSTQLRKTLQKPGDYNIPWLFSTCRINDCGIPIILQINSEKKTATIVDKNEVAVYLDKLIRDPVWSDCSMSMQKLSDVALEWAYANKHRKKLPKALGFLSDPEIVLHRLEFDPACNLEDYVLRQRAPLFFSTIGRMENSEAFCARVGSAFDLTAHRKQCVWLQGPPDSGKSAIVKIMLSLLGESYFIFDQKSLTERWWKASLVGKRVMIVNETRSGFLRSEDFKNLTGDLIHNIRDLWGRAYLAELNVIVFFVSNHELEVPNDEALLRRIILCRLDSIPPDQMLTDAEFDKRIKAELPYIARYCLNAWAKHKDSPRIAVDNHSAIGEAVEEFEGCYRDFIENRLCFVKSGYAEVMEVHKFLKLDGMSSTQDQKNLKRILLSMGVSITKPAAADGKRLRHFKGVRLRQSWDALIRGLA